MRSNTSSVAREELWNHSHYPSVDAAEQTLIDAERNIARLRAIQMDALSFIDQAQVATVDGARTLSEWVAARADVSLDTARSLVRTMRRTIDRPTLRSAAELGEASFDRIEAASKVDHPGPDPLFSHLDVHGVLREAARQARISADHEDKSDLDQYLVMQPALDRSWWKIFGGLDGPSGDIVDKAITQAADSLPSDDPSMPRDQAWRRAVGLTVICISDEPAPTQVTVFVDADTANQTSGEAGIYLEAGPRIGHAALQAILCETVTQLILNTDDGQPMRYGRKSRTIPSDLRRAIIHRDHNRCVMDGCDSRNRLQIHHVIPWSQGGPTDPENLITVCWYHHQVAIHRHNLDPYRHPVHQRWRLRPTTRPPPEPNLSTSASGSTKR